MSNIIANKHAKFEENRKRVFLHIIKKLPIPKIKRVQKDVCMIHPVYIIISNVHVAMLQEL